MKSRISEIKTNRPIIHCINNYVTANDVANILLAIGASPIMADNVREVEEITAKSASLNLNFGILNDDKFRSIMLSAKRANNLMLPVTLDPVGVGASSYRRESAKYLLKKATFSVIKGNISEIKTLFLDDTYERGVDASEQISDDKLGSICNFAHSCAKKNKSIIVISGRYDIVANPDRVYIVKNGVKELSHITGSGCMLSALISAFIAKDNCIEAVLTAVTTMGIAGELALEKMKKNKSGNASFRTYLIDEIYHMTDDKLIEYGKYTKYTGGENGE